MTARLFAVLLTWLAFAGAALAQQPSAPPQTGPVKTGHVTLELISSDAQSAPGTTVWAALKQTIAPGWHTYWRNSGDAGQPTQIAWTLPRGVSADAPVWPTPRRQREVSLMTYGYEGQVVAPVLITLPRSAKPGSTVRVTARVDLLVCKDVCIPEGADLALDLPISDKSQANPKTNADIARTLAAAPRPARFQAAAVLKGAELDLAFAGPPLKPADAAGAYFFPYDRKIMDYAAVQTPERGKEGLTLKTKASASLTALSAPVTGVLALADGRAWEVSVPPGTPSPDSHGQGTAPSADDMAAKPAAHAQTGGALGLLAALGFGLLGGLILNLMPCVFPVLAIKAATLARAAHSPGEARAHGLAFLAGVVLTFLALAGVLIGLRGAGQAAGWGFQLQTPGVVAALALLMLAVAMNMSGVFEAGLSAQRAAGGVETGGGAPGAFGTGVLAVLVAAPCTAPFMAAAVGYALTADAPMALAIFGAMGVGLALPFTLLSLSPGLLSALPRPGRWMEGLRHVLAFPMYGAAGWLAWVFVQQTGAEALGLLFAAALALAFALYAFGASQRIQAVGGGLGAIAGLLFAGLGVAACVFLAAMASSTPPETGTETGTAASSDVERALKAETYSPERLTELRSQGRTVFVNFTAAWCVTCKVNERVALSRPDVAQAFAKTGAAYLVGDWTRRDAVIAKTLAEHGRAGVPLYLVYRPGASDPEVLPQLLTPGMVVKALTSASPKA